MVFFAVQKLKKKNYLLLAILGLHCCKSFSLVSESRGFSLWWYMDFSPSGELSYYAHGL